MLFLKCDILRISNSGVFKDKLESGEKSMSSRKESCLSSQRVKRCTRAATEFDARVFVISLVAPVSGSTRLPLRDLREERLLVTAVRFV